MSEDIRMQRSGVTTTPATGGGAEGRGGVAAVVSGLPDGYKPAGKPNRKTITFTIDGRELQAPEGIMLVDAAKYGDVEIPVFCYEPKLGQPVGACRMCLVEIEGIPKLQTACSTPVKDGMSVVTQSQRVREAQNGVVEFLLVNHPLDCPVCDKGGECPLQDITFGWGPGKTRVVEPKRHFEKPLALSPSIAIDRERCILCYRCVRFSQEVSEDYQLVLLERGDHAFVGTFDGHPYIAPFSGNVIELCPVGALTSRAYRFRARPWDIEQGGSVCTLCPAQCNISYTVRDDRVMRVVARDNEAVDDGWLCDKGRFAYQSWTSGERITQPLLRDGDKLRPVSWERALTEAANGLKKSIGNAAALVGGQSTNEEGWLMSRLMREVLQSPDIDARVSGQVDLESARVLFDPAVAATVADIEWAEVVLVFDSELVDDAAIFDLRVRKGVRRNGVKLAVASSRPSALDRNAAAFARFAPGAGEAFLHALEAALGGDGDVDQLALDAGATGEAVRELAQLLGGAQRTVVLWGERLTHGARSVQGARSLANLAARLDLASTPGAGLIEVPSGANARGLREIGVGPNLGPGLRLLDTTGRNAAGIAQALADGELGTAVLFQADPVGSYPNGALWSRALDKANFVISFSAFHDQSIEQHANVVFPAESNAEKEGTVVHPDGRVQRLRQTVSRVGEVQPQWQVLCDLAKRLGSDFGVVTSPMVSQQIFEAVPFYGGLTLDEIGGDGVRWQERDAAAEYPAATAGTFQLEQAPAVPGLNGRLRLGTFRSLWSGPEVRNAETIGFLAAIPQRLELSAADGERLGVKSGDTVNVGADGETVKAVVALRDAVPEGSAFLMEGGEQSGTLLTDAVPAMVEVTT